MYDETFCMMYPTNFIPVPFDQGSKFVHVSIVDTSFIRPNMFDYQDVKHLL
jgi:hypothetical protein